MTAWKVHPLSLLDREYKDVRTREHKAKALLRYEGVADFLTKSDFGCTLF